jgi:hypothetical protein
MTVREPFSPSRGEAGENRGSFEFNTFDRFTTGANE